MPTAETADDPRLAAAQQAFAGAGFRHETIRALAHANVGTPEKLMALTAGRDRPRQGLGRPGSGSNRQVEAEAEERRMIARPRPAVAASVGHEHVQRLPHIRQPCGAVGHGLRHMAGILRACN